ncbi:MAG: hypothetical protein ACNA8W_10870 [Bradymonadaceae bacterium]
MSDEPNDSMLVRLGKNAPGQVARVGRRTASRLREAIEARLEDVLDAGMARLSRELADPENVRRLQEKLAMVAQWSIQMGFRFDPAAKDLFDFVVWIEERHGREVVQTIVMDENLLSDDRLLQFLMSYATLLSPSGFGTEPDSSYTLDQVESLKAEAGRRLLRLLSKLAALESEEDASLGEVEQMVVFFEDAPIPERFKGLAGQAIGRFEDDVDPPERSEPKSGIRRRLERLTTMTRELKEDSQTSLARYVPGLGDRTLKFVVFSYTFFLQTFLLRALIENLPELMEAARQAGEGGGDDDMIDL